MFSLSHCGFSPIYNIADKLDYKIIITEKNGDKFINNLISQEILKISNNNAAKVYYMKVNTVYKKTSFLAGMNSEFINEFYADYISDPKSLPKGWKNFFDGLSEDEKLVFDDLRGPTWSPEKKFKRLEEVLEDKNHLVDHIPFENHDIQMHGLLMHDEFIDINL